ncbi:carbon-nitrogen hydrolase family protein [Modestobacter sp. SYSU DS0875]
MLLALAQTASRPGDVAANLVAHEDRIAEAGAAGAQLVVFPELSLTGYELDLVADRADLWFTPDDARLAPLRAACARAGLTAVVGAPLREDGARLLGALVIAPDRPVTGYGKRRLFGPEQEVFQSGRQPVVLEVAHRRLALGICADLGDTGQAREAGTTADAWVLGVLASTDGWATDAARAGAAATRYGITVAFANHARPSGAHDADGDSGVWTADGAVRTAGPGEQLLLTTVPARLDAVTG